MRNIKHPKFPCRTCTKNVHDKDKAVQCDLCELWIHIKCNNLNYLDYRYLQNCDESWYCIECCSTIVPLELLVNKFSNATQGNSNDSEKILYLNIMTMKKCITLKYLTIINRYPCSI